MQEPDSSEDRVYAELHELAQRMMALENPGITIQPTALVHEAWLRLGGGDPAPRDERAYFYAAAAEAMRRVLIDAARARATQKRGGDWQRVTLVDCAAEGTDEDVDIVRLDAALSGLEAEAPAVAAVVKLRYFAGLTIDKTAEVVGRSPSTVKREWTFALAWLRSRMDRIAEHDA